MTATWLVKALKTRLRFLLDGWLSESEMRRLAKQLARSRFAPLVRYASVMHRARDYDFRGALVQSDGLNFAKAIGPIGCYPGSYFVKPLLADYADQPKCWRRLAAIVPNILKASREARDRLASAWSDEDGWRFGYLNLYESNAREHHGGYDLSGDPGLYSLALTRNSRGANQNAQTIALAATLTARGLPADMIRRNRRRIIVALDQQQTEFPDNDTNLTGQLPSLPASFGAHAKLSAGFTPEYGTTGYRERDRRVVSAPDGGRGGIVCVGLSGRYFCAYGAAHRMRSDGKTLATAPHHFTLSGWFANGGRTSITFGADL